MIPNDEKNPANIKDNAARHCGWGPKAYRNGCAIRVSKGKKLSFAKTIVFDPRLDATTAATAVSHHDCFQCIFVSALKFEKSLPHVFHYVGWFDGESCCHIQA